MHWWAKVVLLMRSHLCRPTHRLCVWYHGCLFCFCSSSSSVSASVSVWLAVIWARAYGSSLDLSRSQYHHYLCCHYHYYGDSSCYMAVLLLTMGLPRSRHPQKSIYSFCCCCWVHCERRFFVSSMRPAVLSYTNDSKTAK